MVIGGQQLFTRKHLSIGPEFAFEHGLTIDGRVLTVAEAAQIMVIPLVNGVDGGTVFMQTIQMVGEPGPTTVTFVNTAWTFEAPVFRNVNILFLLPHTVIGNPGDADPYQGAP